MNPVYLIFVKNQEKNINLYKITDNGTFHIKKSNRIIISAAWKMK